MCHQWEQPHSCKHIVQVNILFDVISQDGEFVNSYLSKYEMFL